MTFQCTLNTRLKKIVVVAAKSKQYFPLINILVPLDLTVKLAILTSLEYLAVEVRNMAASIPRPGTKPKLYS